ncbi:MAG TPA: succinic semialdehyde dehydrogenase [Terriglobia bacterium]|jgi:acyl-CoA reductase-like NAD-dependent aldehyde dehydrogenase
MDPRGVLIEVRNPVTGEVVGQVAETTAGDLAETVERARQAQARWRALPFAGRARIVRRFHDLLLSRREMVLDTIQSETGKARRDALGEIVTVAGTARYYLANGAGHLQVRRRRPAVPVVTSAEIIYKPHGVVGLITPWNYPFLLGVGDAIPALLAGNAVVVKPSALTPLSAVLARELLVESGLDPDLFALAHGAGEVGSELIGRVDYIGFTGGTATGRKVAVAASERLIPYSLELGGKNPMIVLEGAPLDAAATGLIAGAFANSGQTCISVERAYVQESIYAEFARRVAGKTAALKLGWSKSWNLDMGSMISREHAEKVLERIEKAVAGGAQAIAGGRARSELGPAFVEPTVLTNARDDMPISKEETFGPVIALYPVRTAEEAVARANNSEFGLNASIWAKGGQAQEIARQIETGSAVINSTLLIYNSFDVPMGGVKLSGIGRRHGEQGILRYTQAQSIVSSVAAGGGYDSMLMRVRSQWMADALAGILKVWRRL